MSKRACGKVNAGVFFKFPLQAQQEELRQEHQAHVPVPRGPGAVFVMIQAQFGFVFLETSFNWPARAADAHQFAHRSLWRSVAQRVFDFAVGLVAQQQPAFARGRPFRAQIDPEAREGRHQRPLLALGDSVGLPVQQALDFEQVLHRAAGLLQPPLGGTGFRPDLAGAGDFRQVIEVSGQFFQEGLVIAKGTITGNPATAKLLGRQ